MEACLRALEAFISPSAATTCKVGEVEMALWHCPLWGNPTFTMKRKKKKRKGTWMPGTRIQELGGRHCCESHLSSCLSSSLCFGCHGPLHGHRNPDIFDLHTGHFDSPLLCSAVEDSLGTNTQPITKGAVRAERKPCHVPASRTEGKSACKPA